MKTYLGPHDEVLEVVPTYNSDISEVYDEGTLLGYLIDGEGGLRAYPVGRNGHKAVPNAEAGAAFLCGD